jgi:hypothetical protein
MVSTIVTVIMRYYDHTTYPHPPHTSQECAPRSHYCCTSHGVHIIDFYATPPSSLILIDVRWVGLNKGQGTSARPQAHAQATAAPCHAPCLRLPAMPFDTSTGPPLPASAHASSAACAYYSCAAGPVSSISCRIFPRSFRRILAADRRAHHARTQAARARPRRNK